MDVLYPDNADSGLKQLQRFKALLDEQPKARLFLENPTLAAERHHRLLEELSVVLAFDRRISNFIGILVDRNRLLLLEEIISTYQKLLDQRLGIVHARVTAAQALDAPEQEKIAQQLQQATGKKVRLEFLIDPTLIGGVVTQVGSTVYDGSVRQRLQSFKKLLIEE